MNCPYCDSEDIFHVSKWMASCQDCHEHFEKKNENVDAESKNQ